MYTLLYYQNLEVKVCTESNVHKSVLLNKETKSGVTFHFVNEEYDKGQIILAKTIV